MTTDKELLQLYYKGYKDELNGTSSIERDKPIEVRAYEIGANHAMLGDEVRSFDSLSEEQVLKIIKKQ